MFIEALNEYYTKEELKEIAKKYKFKYLYKFNKNELCQALGEELLKPENFINELAVLGTKGVEIFGKFIYEKPLNKDDMDSLYPVIKTPYIFKDGNTILISPQMVDLYDLMDRNLLNDKIKKYDWLKKVLNYCVTFYGIWSFDVFYEIYSKNYKLNVSKNEFMRLYEFLPELTRSSVYKNGYFYADDVIENDMVSYLGSHQMNKPYRIPTLGEIKEYDKKGYLSNVHIQSFIKYLKRSYKMSNSEIENYIFELEHNISDGTTLNDVMDDTSKRFVFGTENDVKEMVSYIQNVHNNTRMRENRGHSPIELRKISK